MTGDLHSVAGWIAPGITAGPTQRPVDGHNLNNHALLARALTPTRPAATSRSGTNDRSHSPRASDVRPTTRPFDGSTLAPTVRDGPRWEPVARTRGRADSCRTRSATGPCGRVRRTRG